RRVVVLLDALAPGAGAFAHAREWSVRLDLPVHGLLAPSLGAGTAEAARDCMEACVASGVLLELSTWRGRAGPGMLRLLPEGDLLVLGHAISPERKRELFREAGRSPGTAVLICPAEREPISRVLLIDQGTHSNYRLLSAAVNLARLFPFAPVLLTVARSARAAQQRQLAARQALGAMSWHMDF